MDVRRIYEVKLKFFWINFANHFTEVYIINIKSS